MDTGDDPQTARVRGQKGQQGDIHDRKGALTMYGLKEVIGEAAVSAAG